MSPPMIRMLCLGMCQTSKDNLLQKVMILVSSIGWIGGDYRCVLHLMATPAQHPQLDSLQAT